MPNESMRLHELMAGLTGELPPSELLRSFEFLQDDLLPRALTPVDPASFALACVRSLWGGRGACN